MKRYVLDKCGKCGAEVFMRFADIAIFVFGRIFTRTRYMSIKQSFICITPNRIFAYSWKINKKMRTTTQTDGRRTLSIRTYWTVRHNIVSDRQQ